MVYLSLSVPIRKNGLILIQLSDKKKPPMKWMKPVNGFFSGGGEQEKLVTALLELNFTIATIRKQVNRLSSTGSNQGKWILMADHTQFEQFLNKAYLGITRFSLEGGDGLIPALYALTEALAASGCLEINGRRC